MRCTALFEVSTHMSRKNMHRAAHVTLNLSINCSIMHTHTHTTQCMERMRVHRHNDMRLSYLCKISTRCCVVYVAGGLGAFVEGMRKKQALPLPPERLQVWFGQLVEGLTVMHEHKVLHRNLKPSSIYLAEDGSVKIGKYNRRM